MPAPYRVHPTICHRPVNVPSRRSHGHVSRHTHPRCPRHVRDGSRGHLQQSSTSRQLRRVERRLCLRDRKAPGMPRHQECSMPSRASLAEAKYRLRLPPVLGPAAAPPRTLSLRATAVQCEWTTDASPSDAPSVRADRPWTRGLRSRTGSAAQRCRAPSVFPRLSARSRKAFDDRFHIALVPSTHDVTPFHPPHVQLSAGPSEVPSCPQSLRTIPTPVRLHWPSWWVAPPWVPVS